MNAAVGQMLEYMDFYNTVRPHGATAGPLEPLAMPAEGAVLCEHRLGGSLGQARVQHEGLQGQPWYGTRALKCLCLLRELLTGLLQPVYRRPLFPGVLV